MIIAKINVAELLGAEYILHTEIDGQSLKAVVHARQDLTMDQDINLAFDMRHAHFFDPKTEKSLLQL